MQAASYDGLRDAIRGESLPLAMVDLAAFDANVALVRRLAGSKPVRVASKSVRCVDLLRRVLDEGAPFAGLLTFTIAEACDLAEQGFDDLLVAYPSCDRASLTRAAELKRSGKSIVIMVDATAHVDAARDAAKAAGVELELCIDVDMSTDFGPLHFGVNRSPLVRTEDVAAVARYAKSVGHVSVVGMMGYEAQVAGVPDRVPGKGAESALVRRLKKSSLGPIRARRAAASDAIASIWGPLRIVNAGGSGSLTSSREEEVVTEVTAGSAFFAPHLFDHYDQLPVRPAAFFALEVARIAAADIYTCLGGGYVASGEPGADRAPQVYAPAGGSLVKHQGAGEVQTPVRFSDGLRLQHGDPVFFRHAKAGELCERFAELVLVQDGRVVGRARTYRGEGKTYI